MRHADITVHSLPVEPTVVAALRAIAASGTPLSADHAVEVMRDSYRSYVQQNTPRFRALFAHLLEDRAPLVIHCTAGKDRTGFACALILHTLGVPDEVISEDYLLTNRSTAATPTPPATCPITSSRCWARCSPRSSAPRSKPSTPTMAVSKPISGMASVSAQTSAQRSRRAICKPDLICEFTRRIETIRAAGLPCFGASLSRDRLGRGFHFHFSIEIGDDVLECLDRLLDRRNLHQLPVLDRTVAILQRDDQVPPLLLKLNKR